MEVSITFEGYLGVSTSKGHCEGLVLNVCFEARHYHGAPELLCAAHDTWSCWLINKSSGCDLI